MFRSTINLKSDAAKSMYDYVKKNFEQIFFFFGKSSAWNTADTRVEFNELERPAKEILKDFILLYKIDRNAVSLCFERVDWKKDTIMTQYNYLDSSLKCYAMTKDFNVYKCISNNNGSLALYEPNHITFDVQDYADGYKWKYLYTLSTLQKRAFLSANRIPIEIYPTVNSMQHLTEFNAVPGTIDSYNIVNGGSGYATADTVKITGDGTGATGKLVQQGGIIKRVTITNPGKNYTWATVVITSATGILGEITANISPLAGHGSNLMQELNVSSIMINSKTLSPTQDVSAVPKLFNYRRIGILSGINQTHSELIPMCYKVQVEDSTGFVNNTKVTLNTTIKTTCNIVYSEIILGEHFIYLNEPDRPLTSADFINKTITSVDNTTINTRILNPLYIPSINKNFNILYLENLSKNTCVDRELDILRIVIDF